MGFDQLNHDCICSILEWVDDVSPQTTRDSTRFVSKEFYAATQTIAHRRKALSYPSIGHCLLDSSEHDIRSWLANDQVMRGLHYLKISTGYPEALTVPDANDLLEAENRKFENLALLISKLGNLKLLEWAYRGPIPLQILEALHKCHPKAELRVYNFTRLEATADHQDAAEIALSKSPALTVLRASIWGNADHPDLREAAFQRVVAAAPNLRSASVTKGRSGCVVRGYSKAQMDELDELTAKFITNHKPSASMRSLTLDGYSMSEYTLKDWATIVDLSKLESLKCSRGEPDISYFTYAPQVLKSLKHVSLNFSYGGEQVKDVAQAYISEVAPLESLSLWSWMGVVPLETVLSRHGKTLRTLQLHERETSTDGVQTRREILSEDDLVNIKYQCPLLRDFTFDIDRHSKSLKPRTELDRDANKWETIASMNLDKLQVYYDLGIGTMTYAYGVECGSDEEEYYSDTDGADLSGRSPPAKRQKKVIYRPSTHESIEAMVKELWKRIYGSRSNTTGRALDVKFGEWERKIGVGYPASWVLEESAQKTFWLVRPSERDDQLGECSVQMRSRSS